MQPLFSIVLITKNEANVLQRALYSLQHFRERGGEIVILDTGSTDRTVEIAKQNNCVVHVSTAFTNVLEEQYIDIINAFAVGNEEPLVQHGDVVFDFAKARNHVTSLAKNDFVFTLDADEVYSVLNIDRINELITEGYEHFEYSFTYSFDQWGKPLVKFNQSKAFDRRKMKWNGIVHETLEGTAKSVYLDESVVKLDHHQEFGKTHRSNYLKGLAYSVLLEPENDRNRHYFGRELMYSGRYKSAIIQLRLHTEMNKWNAEKAQSFIFMGDCYGNINDADKQLQFYHKAFNADSNRRESLIKIAYYYLFYNNWQAAICFAKAALEIPMNEFYGNEIRHYTDSPHSVLYKGYGWLGNIPKAQEHIEMCLKYEPYSLEYLRDTKFYFEYGAPEIEGWMRWDELKFLFNLGKKYDTVLEGGSWKGRSSHALLSGSLTHGGKVICVDTWEGSDDVRDLTNTLAKQEDVFAVFQKNVGHFPNLVINRKRGTEAANDYADGSIDCVFIDMGHTYEDVKKDIEAWLPKCRKMICGHDFDRNTWMGVCEAVDEAFGRPDGVADTIWWVDLEKRRQDRDGAKREHPLSPKDCFVDNSIPRNIYTAWLSDEPMPEKIAKIIETQRLEGHNHIIFTLENIHDYVPVTRFNSYLDDAINAKKWVKAVDYLRAIILFNYGGIFLDADVEILEGKNFDSLLGNKMFCAREDNGFIGYSVVGSVKEHIVFMDYLIKVTETFKGDDDLFFESSMEVFTTLVNEHLDEVTVLNSDVFFPYNHQTGEIKVTENTLCFHHFWKSWVGEKNDKLPTISILIPHIAGTRKEGLKRCLKSIDKSYYPKHLIEVYVIEGDDTVPEKIKRGVEMTTGKYICYAANDMEFTPEALYLAQRTNYGLVSFNEGKLLPDNGNICTHFMIKRDLLPLIGGEIFSTRYHHVGVDNLLWAKCSKIGEAMYCKEAKINHYHFSKGYPLDEVYIKGWNFVDKDREILAHDLLVL